MLFSTFLDVSAGRQFSIYKVENRSHFETCQLLVSNNDRRTLICEIEQLDYVRVAHSRASVARQVADFVLGPGAVNVKRSCAGVVRIQAIKP